MGTGDNISGQLGLGDFKSRNIFTEIPNTKDIVQVACAYSYTLMLGADGSLSYAGYICD